MVLHLAVLTAALSPGLQPPRAVPRRSAILSRNSPPTAAVAADAGRAVASWCVSAGREHATVAVSGADCIAGVLRDFWSVARVFAQEDGSRGRQRVLALPSWEEGSYDPQLFQALLQHIVACAEICEYVGDSLLVAGRHPAAVSGDEPDNAPCPMLLLRAYTQAASSVGEVYSGTNPYSGADPYGSTDPHAGKMDALEQSWASDECVLGQTRAWVQGIIVNMKVCPFSSTADKAGMPIGGVSYPISHARTGEEVYEAFWSQVLQVAETDEKMLSTVLLLTPRFALHSSGGFDLLADTLNGALTTLRVERYLDRRANVQRGRSSRARLSHGLACGARPSRDIQLVFFHPEYTFRDGKERLGDGAEVAANFARRSPFPMINLLRTPQVCASFCSLRFYKRPSARPGSS